MERKKGPLVPLGQVSAKTKLKREREREREREEEFWDVIC